MRYTHSINGKTYYTLENEYKSIAEYKTKIKACYGSLRGVKVWECSPEEYNLVKQQRRAMSV